MIDVGLIKVPAVLRQKLGDDGTDALIDVLNKILAQPKIYTDAVISQLATKEDLVLLRGELKREIATTRADLIKWMFVFWVGQTGVIIALLTLFYQLLVKAL